MSDYFFESPLSDVSTSNTFSGNYDSLAPSGDVNKPFSPEASGPMDGWSSRNVYYLNDMMVTEYYSSGSGFIGATYAYQQGGGSWFTASGNSGAWGGSTSYWSIGGSLGIGFGIWGTGNGDWGIAWNAGIGAYALAGDAESAGAAIATVTDETYGIYWDNNGLIDFIEVDFRTGEINYDEIGFNLGIYGTSPDPGPPVFDDIIRGRLMEV
jgi:hypothetical protein